VTGRFVSAVALYGPKAPPLRDLIEDIQRLVAGWLGDSFRPYSLEQIHATLIAFNGVRDPATGAVVNEYFLANAGLATPMNICQAMDLLAARFAAPLSVQFGGHRDQQDVPFTSRGQHPFERGFSVQGEALVLIGWPTAALSGRGQPLDQLRRDLNSAGLLHRYHQRATDVDDDVYLVIGHHAGAPAAALAEAVRAVRERLAEHPVEAEIGLADVKIVAADSHTMAPPIFVGDIPVDEATLLSLIP
jgi:hypothetical protein